MATKKADNSRNFLELSALVRKRGVEPPLPKKRPSEDRASTDFATCALNLSALLLLRLQIYDTPLILQRFPNPPSKVFSLHYYFKRASLHHLQPRGFSSGIKAKANLNQEKGNIESFFLFSLFIKMLFVCSCSRLFVK